MFHLKPAKHLVSILIFLLSFLITLVFVTYLGNKLININPQPNFDKIKRGCISQRQLDMQCLSDALEEVIKNFGITAGFDLVSYIYESEPRFSQNCHALVHKLGETAYFKFSQNQDFDLSPKAAFCAYGFYHGFMETLIIKTGDLKKARQFCDYVDSQLAKQTSDAKLQCYHGIGHGMAGIHDPNIKGREQALIDPAIELCEKVSETNDQLYRCASGVFNAIAIFYKTGEYQLPLDKNDPLKICRKQKDIHKNSCFGNMNVMLMHLTNGDFQKAAKFVENINEDEYAITAIRYLSPVPAIDYIGKHHELISACRSLQNRLQQPCFKGISIGLLEHGQPGVEYVEGFKFCRLPQLSDQERHKCFKTTVDILNLLYDEQKIKSICSKIEPEYRQYCLR